MSSRRSSLLVVGLTVLGWAVVLVAMDWGWLFHG